MKYRKLIDWAFSLTFRNFSLWVVVVILSVVALIASLMLASTDAVLMIIDMLVALVITAMVSGALIWMVNELAEKREIGVGVGLMASVAHIVRLVEVELLIQAPTWIVLVLFTGSWASIFGALGQPNGISATNLTSLVGSLTVTFVLVFLLGLFLGAIQVGAQRAVVLEGAGVLAALKRGWQLLVSHIGNFIVLGLMMLLFALVFGLLFGCGSSLFAIGAATSTTPGSPLSAATVIFAILGLLEGALSQILFSAMWTLAFRFWQGKDDAAPVLPVITEEAPV